MDDARWIRDKQGIHVYDADGSLRAEAWLEPTPEGAWDVTHTFVAERERGTGLSGELMRQVVALAEKEGVPLVASCPFAAAWLERHADEVG